MFMLLVFLNYCYCCFHINVFSFTNNWFIKNDLDEFYLYIFTEKKKRIRINVSESVHLILQEEKIYIYKSYFNLENSLRSFVNVDTKTGIC